MLRVNTDEVKAAALLYSRAPREVQAEIRKASQRFAPQLRDAAMRHASGTVDKKIAASGKTTVTAKGLKAVFGSTGSVGGTKLRVLAGPYEFGTGARDRYTTYTQRRQGTTFRTKRRTRTQLPPRTPSGRFMYPAVADTTPRLVRMWIGAILRGTTGE